MVAKALEAALRTRAVPGAVSHVLGGGVDRGSPTYVFRVDRPEPMAVCRIDFEGVSPVFADTASARVRTAIGQSYSRDFLERLVQASVITFYGQRGYLKASVGTVRARPVEEDGCHGGVSVTVPIAEGRQYLRGGATWVGIGEAPVQELDGLLGMSADAPVDTERLATSLLGVRDYFARQGYFATVVRRAFSVADDGVRATAVVTVTRGPEWRARVLCGSGAAVRCGCEGHDGLDDNPPRPSNNALHVSEFLKATRANFPDVFSAFPQTTVTTTPTTSGRVAVTIDVLQIGERPGEMGMAQGFLALSEVEGSPARHECPFTAPSAVGREPRAAC